MHVVRLMGDTKTLLWMTGPFVYAQIDLPMAARVLEVGGGQDPHPAANVIVEKFLDDNKHRMMGADPITKSRLRGMTRNGPGADVGAFNPDIVQADVEDMPFEDKSFDFVICKDVLEHVDNPVKAAAEMSRVGKAGFLDTPKLTSEMLWPQPLIHKWVFDYDGRGGLVGRAIEFVSPFGNILHKMFEESGDFQAAWAASRYHFHCVMFWQNELRVTIGEPVRG
jgi:ubiquinone/menaquinone biosynthesis C-methylase UbiE